MNDYNGLVCDIASLISFDMDKNDIKTILSNFEDVMTKYNIPKYIEGTTNITDMRMLCENLLTDSFKNHISCYFLFG